MNGPKFSSLWRSLIPIILMTLCLLPLLFVLVKRYFSPELISFSLVNSLIMSAGILLNIFVFSQLIQKVKKSSIYGLILFVSAGVSLFSLVFIVFNDPLFFLYGRQLMVSYIAITFIIVLSLSLFSFEFYNNQQLIEEERERKEREIELRKEMERQIYSSRINPHFLFNSLNLMVSLLDDKEKAEEVLIQLSELLRYSLEASGKEAIPLKEELENVEKYLFIQKERFGKRLEYEIKGSSEKSVPPLLIQPLVENSVKHNLQKVDSVKITISVTEEARGLVIGVCDSQALLQPDMLKKGTGLTVTQKRVELSEGSFEIKEGGVEICLPIK